MIKDLQLEYAELIQKSFDFELEQLKDIDFEDLPAAIERIVNDSLVAGTFPTKRTFLDNKFDYFLSDQKKYWDKAGPIIQEYLNKTDKNTMVIWPNDPIIELIPRYLLYHDIILIPDPIMHMGQSVISDRLYRDAFLYFLIVGFIKKLPDYDSESPSVIFVPYQKGFLGHTTLGKDSDLAVEYSISPGGKIAREAFKQATRIEHDFQNMEQLMDALQKQPINKLNKSLDVSFIKNMLNFLIEDPNFLQRARAQGTLDFIVKKRLFSQKMIFEDFMNLFGILNSFYSIFETREYNAAKLNTVNLISSSQLPLAEFKQKQVLNSYGIAYQIPEKELINYSIKQSFDWLDNIDLTTCMELRSHPELEDYRNILRQEAAKIKLATYSEFTDIARNFEENVTKKLRESHEKIETEANNLLIKRRGTIGSFIAATGLTFSSMAFPNLLPLEAITTAAGVYGGAGLRDVYANVFKLEGKIDELNRKPISLIYKASLQKTT